MVPGRVLVSSAAMAVWDWFFPPVCLVCQVPIMPREGEFLCQACRSEMRVLAPIGCPCRSENGASWEERQRACDFCRRLPFSFDSMRSAFPYAGVMGELIRNLKYRHGEVAGRAVAQLCIAACGEELSTLRSSGKVDLVVPVPMHFARQIRRGYNQAACIAEALAQLLLLDYEANGARRCRRTPPQVRRAKKRERLKNVEGAFDVTRPELIQDRKILLVDDVSTTGATVSSCAAALRSAGARAIHVFTVCRAGGMPSIPAPAPMRGEN